MVSSVSTHHGLDLSMISSGSRDDKHKNADTIIALHNSRDQENQHGLRYQQRPLTSTQHIHINMASGCSIVHTDIYIAFGGKPDHEQQHRLQLQ